MQKGVFAGLGNDWDLVSMLRDSGKIPDTIVLEGQLGPSPAFRRR
jgi:hypothetical protein